MLVTPLGMTMLVRLLQSWKAQPPMLVTLSGMVMLVRLLQSLKAPSPILVTPSGMHISVSSPSLGVGDSGLDIKMYQNASCMSLGVQTGVWSGDALLTLKPDMLLKSIGDLTSYL